MKKTIIPSALFVFFTVSVFSQEFVPIKIQKTGMRTQYMQNDQILRRKELPTILTSYSESALELKIASRNGTIGSVLVGSGCLIIGASSFVSTLKDLKAVNSGSGDFSEVGAGPFLIGCGVVLAGIPFLLISNSHFVKSINLYNSQTRTGSLTRVNLKIGVTPNRTGIILRF